MSIALPKEITPAITSWEAFDILIEGDKSIGKSGFLASIPDYLLIDPEDGLDAYPGYKVKLTTWKDHLDLLQTLAEQKERKYAGIGMDTLNASYDLCSYHTCKKLNISHPSDEPRTAWSRITTEFITWLSNMRLLGYHIVATCHTTIKEIRILGRSYDSWIPAFSGGGPDSTYAKALRKFKIIGFMTFDEVVRPSTVVTNPKTGTTTVDVRVDVSDRLYESRVIHFAKSNYWVAGDTSHMLPEKIVLSDKWEDDWKLFTEAWGSGQVHTISDKEIQTTGQIKEG